MNTTNTYKANREYKSTLFAKLFGENKENALSLYNAINDSHYTNADDLIFTTLEDVADGVLEKFLSRHRKEVRNMVLTEFDEEKFLKMVRAEERAEGRIETLMGILCDLGEIPPQIIDRAKALDAITLKEWTKLAARSENMAEFFEKIG